jgi:hydrogenase maturation protein HypF
METSRLQITITGAVQGVGFRPFIFRLALESGLTGWVNNTSEGVVIEAEGTDKNLKIFLNRIIKEKPHLSFIQSLESSYLDPVGYKKFEIRESNGEGEKKAPDIATCPECLLEIFDSSNRRYRYPFTNCTHCGPRYSIIEALPYDRSNTTMRDFEMCDNCYAEYEDPLDRRFHAQPNACPDCGPHLELWNGEGKVLSSHDEALLDACHSLLLGAIVAIKGLGGFHLVVDGRSDEDVNRLRQLKHREEKPFALMYPSIEKVKEDCAVSEIEGRLLTSPASPIVLLLRRMKQADVSESSGSAQTGKISSLPESGLPDSDQVGIPARAVAPGNPNLGVMLPYTPLHHLLMNTLDFPVVATSGNLSDEPICTDEREALDRLGHIADVFLVHNRPIARHVDDSILRVISDRTLMLRRARGYAPLPIHINKSLPSVLAVGGHLKNTIATSREKEIYISQHIGDLETVEAYNAFKGVIKSFQNLYDYRPEKIVCDIHPDYLSTQYARASHYPVSSVQHHYAHILSCMAENELDGILLGVAWDGSGYGLDNTIWGGEFLKIDEDSFLRTAHFRTFRLPGGEKAIREPSRTAIGLLYEIFGESVFSRDDLIPLQEFSEQDRKILQGMLNKRINAPLTSSVGRLFDAIASIVGLRQHSSFEGQAAMELEYSLDGVMTEDRYPFRIAESGVGSKEMPYVIDWSPILLEILEDVMEKNPPGKISAKFHNTLAEIILAVAKRVREKRVVLSGGCFQNKYLTERTIQLLKDEGFRPYWHQRVPPNDGGIVLGQTAAVLRSLK